MVVRVVVVIALLSSALFGLLRRSIESPPFYREAATLMMVPAQSLTIFHFCILHPSLDSYWIWMSMLTIKLTTVPASIPNGIKQTI